MPFYSVPALPAAHPLRGATRLAVYLEQLMLTFFEFEDGTIIPDHGHPQEQITYVLSGTLEFTLEGETRLLHAGEGAVVPPNARHSIVVRGRATALDGWSPVREDYK